MRTTLLTAVLLSCLARVEAALPQLAPAADDYTALLFHLDDQGRDAADAVPGSKAGQRSGGAWVAGKFGGAFDCHNGAIRVPHTSAMDVGEQLTIEAWVKVEGKAEELQRIAYRSGVYGLYLDPSGTRLTFYVSAGGAWTGLNTTIPPQRWVHLAGTYDGRVMRLFVDGEKVEEQPLVGPITESPTSFEIGGEAGAMRRFLNGLVDEVRISSVARTDFDQKLTWEPTTTAKLVALPEGEVPIAVPDVTLGRGAQPPVIDGQLGEDEWAGALELELLDSKPGAVISQPTRAKLTWDEAHIYLSVRCHEVLLDKLKADVTEHDGAVWSDDAVELFLRPPGAQPYYHLSVNSRGVVYDAKCLPKADTSWESGAATAGQIGKSEWTLEVALSFEAFGAGPTGAWRGNVCRSRVAGGEVSAWAPVGGSFHRPGRFGIWRFGAQPTQPAETSTSLEGRVVDDQGEPVVGVLLSSPGGTARSESGGKFRLTRLPRGTTKLVASSGHHEPLAVEVELKQPTERVILPPLTPIDPNQLQAGVPASGVGFVLYAVPPFDDVDPAALPAELAGQPLQTFGVAGQTVDLGLTIAASQALSEVRFELGELKGSAGMIPASAAKQYLLKRILMRTHYSRPAEDVLPRSRYLLDNQSFAMPAGTFRRGHVLLTLPEGTKPGVYRGSYNVTVGGRVAGSVPVEVEVLGIKLDPPEKHYALYYRTNLTPDSEPIVRAELADMRAHGADRILWNPRINYTKDGDAVQVDYSQIETQVELTNEFGYQGPLIVWDGFERLSAMTDGEEGPEFLKLAKQAILGLRKLAKDKGWPEIVLTHMDEVFNRERLDRFIRLAKAIRQVPEQRIYITFHSRPTPEVAAMTAEIDPYVDLRCYHGHSIDDWVSAGHTFREFGEQLHGDEAWCYYNLRGAAENAEWSRLSNGYWLWLTPLSTHCPWAYNSWRGDPLNDADGYDFGYAFPVDGKLVSTRQWEAFRAGVDDLRFLTTLENRLKQVTRRDHNPQVAAARKFIDGLKQTLQTLPVEPGQSAYVKAMVDRYGEADYDGWRRECAQHIAALEALGR